MVSQLRGVIGVVALVGCATVPPPIPSSDVLLSDGSRASFESLLTPSGSGVETVVVFATVWCEICRRERPEVEAWARAHRETERTVYVFSGGELPGVVDQIRGFHLDPALAVVVDADGRLADRYAIESTPTILRLNAEGRVLSSHHRFAEVTFK